MPCIQFQCPGPYHKLSAMPCTFFRPNPCPPLDLLSFSGRPSWKQAQSAPTVWGCFCTYQQQSFSKQYTSCLTDIISCFYFSTDIMQNEDWKQEIHGVPKRFSNVSVRTLLQWISLLGPLQPWRHWLTVNNGSSPMLCYAPLSARRTAEAKKYA